MAFPASTPTLRAGGRSWRPSLRATVAQRCG